MGTDNRILGRDITIRATQGNTLLDEVTAIKNLTVKIGLKLLSEGFFGEAALRHREIFEEIVVNFGIEPEGEQIFRLVYAVYQRSRTGQANPVQINLAFRMQFPSGKIIKITIPDIQFENVGDLNVASRDAFADMTFAAKASKYIPSF
jgi:hypothetical protein